MAKAAKKEAAPKTTEPKAPVVADVKAPAGKGRGRKSDEPEAYGVRRPGEGTTTRAIWDLVDSMLGTDNEIPTRKSVMDAAAEKGLNISTASTQYGKYRIFHGLGPEPKAPKVDAETPAKLPEPEVKEAVEEVETTAEEEVEEVASDEDSDVID